MGLDSAHMRQPHPAELGVDHPRGVVNTGRAELTDLMTRVSR